MTPDGRHRRHWTMVSPTRWYRSPWGARTRYQRLMDGGSARAHPFACRRHAGGAWRRSSVPDIRRRLSRWWRRRRGHRSGTAGQRAHARDRRARAGRRRVPVLGLRAVQDPAALERDAERGRACADARGVTGGLGRRLPQGLDARAVDGPRPRRHPAGRRHRGDRRTAVSRSREPDRPAHRRGRSRAARCAPRRGDRQRQHRGDPADPGPGHRRVLDQPPGSDSAGTAGLARDPRCRCHRRRAGAGVRAPRVQGDDDRGRADVPRPRGARSGSRAAAAPRSRRHHARDRRPVRRRRAAGRRSVTLGAGRRSPEVGRRGARRPPAGGHRPPRQRRRLARERASRRRNAAG